MSKDFLALKQTLQNESIKREFEWILDIAVQQYSPSDRGNRWIIGGIVEWAIAILLLESGVIALPDGHNADSHDLRGLLDKSRNLWSVKSSFSENLGSFILSNGMGGAGAGFKTATVFAHPKLPGLVYIDPDIHFEVASKVIAKGGETRLHGKEVLAHSEAFPDCVAYFKMPINKGTNSNADPAFIAIRQILKSNIFHNLNKSFSEITSSSNSSIIELLEKINRLQSSGLIQESEAREILGKLMSDFHA